MKAYKMIKNIYVITYSREMGGPIGTMKPFEVINVFCKLSASDIVVAAYAGVAK